MINHLRRQLDEKEAFLQAMNRTIQSVPGLAAQVQLPPSTGAQGTDMPPNSSQFNSTLGMGALLTAGGSRHSVEPGLSNSFSPRPPYEHSLAGGGGQSGPEPTAQQINASPYFQNRIPLANAHAGAEQAARGPGDAYGNGGPPMQPLSNGMSVYGGRGSASGSGVPTVDSSMSGRYGHLADPHMQSSQPMSMGALVSWEGNTSLSRCNYHTPHPPTPSTHPSIHPKNMRSPQPWSESEFNMMLGTGSGSIGIRSLPGSVDMRAGDGPGSRPIPESAEMMPRPLHDPKNIVGPGGECERRSTYRSPSLGASLCRRQRWPLDTCTSRMDVLAPAVTRRHRPTPSPVMSPQSGSMMGRSLPLVNSVDILAGLRSLPPSATGEERTLEHGGTDMTNSDGSGGGGERDTGGSHSSNGSSMSGPHPGDSPGGVPSGGPVGGMGGPGAGDHARDMMAAPRSEAPMGMGMMNGNPSAAGQANHQRVLPEYTPLDEWRGLSNFTPKGADQFRGLGPNGMMGGGGGNGLGGLGGGLGGGLVSGMSAEMQTVEILQRGQDPLMSDLRSSQLGYSPSSEFVRAFSSPANMNGSIADRQTGAPTSGWSPRNLGRNV